MQALGGQGIIQAQCKAVIKQYVPQILEIIDTLPVDQVCCRCGTQRHTAQPTGTL